MSSSDIVVPKLLPIKPRPESFDGRVRALVREYRRVEADVLPSYTELIGESGIGAIAAEVKATPASPNFWLYVARAASRRLEARIANLKQQPPSASEIAIIKTFCELGPNSDQDRDLLDYAIGYVLVRHASISPLEAEIRQNDPRLIQVWHQSAKQDGKPGVIDPRTWLYSEQTTGEPTAPAPAPKPRIIN